MRRRGDTVRPDRDKFQQKSPGLRKCVVCSGKGRDRWLKLRAGRRIRVRDDDRLGRGPGADGEPGNV